jgi:hypothetical protein
MSRLAVGDAVQGTTKNRGWPGTNKGIVTLIEKNTAKDDSRWNVHIRFGEETKPDKYTCWNEKNLEGDTIMLWHGIYGTYVTRLPAEVVT